MIEWTVSVGNLIEIAAIVGGALTMFFAMRSDIRVLGHDVKRIELRQDTLGQAFTQLGNILTKVAVQDTRIGMIEKSFDELRHGQGFVTK